MNAATFLMLMQSVQMSLNITSKRPQPEEVSAKEDVKPALKSDMKYLYNDPMQLEVREILKRKYK